MNKRLLCTWCVILAGLATLAPIASAAELEVFAGVVGGVGTASIPAGCTTFGPPSELAFFGSAPLGMQVFGGNAACGYSGGWTNLKAPGAPAGTVLPNAASLGPTLLGNPGFAGSYDGTANAKASYGSLGAGAQGEFTAGLPGSPFALFYAMSAATFSDTLTAMSPLVATLSPGSVQYVFHLDGNASAPGAPAPFFFGEARAQVFVQHQGGPAFALPQVDATRGAVGSVSNGTPAPPGWTVATGMVSGGSDFLTLSLPMVWGQPWDVKVGLLVWADGQASADSMSTATLAGLRLFDASGARIEDFTVAAASGTPYFAAAAVPEPSTFALLAAGLATLAGAAHRRRESGTTRGKLRG